MTENSINDGLFKGQYVEVAAKYEGKIKELSLLKEMGLVLRSSSMVDQSAAIVAQLKIIQKVSGLQKVSLLRVESRLRIFKVIDADGGLSWRPMLKDAASLTVQTKTHIVERCLAGLHGVCVPVLNQSEVIAVLRLEDASLADPDNHVLSFYKIVADQLATAIIMLGMHARMLHKEKQRLHISRFFSRNVAQKIFSGHRDAHIGGTRQKIAVMFADLCGFTSMSEKMDQEEVVRVLNDFLSLMTPIIFKHDGTLDKLLGDGVLAFFGAPVSHSNDSVRAVLAAMEMQNAVRERRVSNPDAPQLHLSIGINVGEAIVGYIGTDEHMNYTAIGDVVNTAQRLESAAEEDTILMGYSVWEEVKDCPEVQEGIESVAEPLPLTLRGKKESVRVCRIIPR